MLGGGVSDVRVLLVPVLLLLGDPGVVIIQPELSDTLLLAKSEILNRSGHEAASTVFGLLGTSSSAFCRRYLSG